MSESTNQPTKREFFPAFLTKTRYGQHWQKLLSEMPANISDPKVFSDTFKTYGSLASESEAGEFIFTRLWDESWGDKNPFFNRHQDDDVEWKRIRIIDTLVEIWKLNREIILDSNNYMFSDFRVESFEGMSRKHFKLCIMLARYEKDLHTFLDAVKSKS